MRGERQMNKNSQRLEDGASGSPYVNRCGEYAPTDTDCLDAIQKLLQTTILRTAGHTAA